MKKALRLLALALVLAGCATTERQARVARLREQPSRQLEAYDFSPGTPLAGRIGPAPAVVLDFLQALDGRVDYRAYDPDTAERELLTAQLDFLPLFYLPLFHERLLGIYLVENFQGSGYTDYVLARDGTMYTYIVINPATMHQTMSKWLTQKESTAFISGDTSPPVRLECGDLPASLYVLLHEGAHCVDYVRPVTPYVEPEVRGLSGPDTEVTPFTEGTWASYTQPDTQVAWPYAGKVHFYGFREPELRPQAASRIYGALDRQTPFMSLYSTMNWADDFADYLTFYHLTQKLKQPYRIHLLPVTFPVQIIQYRPYGESRLGRHPIYGRPYSPPIRQLHERRRAVIEELYRQTD